MDALDWLKTIGLSIAGELLKLKLSCHVTIDELGKDLLRATFTRQVFESD